MTEDPPPSAAATAVVGPGAIGMLFAAALGRAGREVVLCPRRPLDYPRIRVDRGGQSWETPVGEVPQPGVKPDWILLATKAYDVADAALWLDDLAHPGTTVVVLQHGVDHADRVRRWLPEGVRVLPTVLRLGSEVAGPGHVIWTFGDSVAVPADNDGARFAALMSGSPIGVDRVVDFEQLAWRHLLVNLIVNPVTALTGRRLDVFADSGFRELARDLAIETSAIARAAGVDLPAATAIDATIDFIDTLAPHTATSMLLDRQAGRPTEHESMVGSVVLLADRHAIPVPAIRTLLTLLRGASPADNEQIP